MTVVAAIPRQVYIEDGVTLSFPVPFAFSANGNIVVHRLIPPADPVVIEPAAIVGAGSPSGGTVTLASTVAGAMLIIERMTARAQTMNYTTGDDFPAKSHEAALDRAMMIDQEQDAGLADVRGRALLVPAGETAGRLPPAADRAGKFMIGTPGGGFTFVAGGGGSGDTGLRSDLAANDGAGHVGFDQSVNFPRDSVGAKLAQFASVKDAPYNAAGDGLMDDRAAFHAADAAGPFIVPPGRYLIGASITINNVMTVQPGARFVIPSGVTVTCNSSIDAGEYQIVDLTGTGNLGGLVEAKQAWFDGDIATLPGLPASATACDTALQAAFNSLAVGGVLRGDPRTRVKGATLILATDGSYDGNGVSYLWNSAITNGFNIAANTTRSWFRNFTFAPLVPGTIATSGVALLIGRSDLKVSNFKITDCYGAVDVRAGVSSSVTDFSIYGAVFGAIRVQTLDQFISDGVIQALYDWVDLAGVTGTFNVGDTLAISGSVGFIAETYAAFPNRIRAFFNDAIPMVGNTITSSSGGSATISAVTIGHQIGGVRLEPISSSATLEAVAFQNMDVLGGLNGLTISNAAGGIGRVGHAAFNRFADSVYFDSPYNGSSIDGAYGTVFDCWFANSRVKSKPGAFFTNCGRTRIGGHFVSNSGAGVQLDGNCVSTTIDRADFDGNCRNHNSEPGMAELVLVGAIQRVTVTNITIGFTGINGITPPKGIYIEPAGSDYLKFAFIQCGGVGIAWGSTGTHNRRVAVDTLTDL